MTDYASLRRVAEAATPGPWLLGNLYRRYVRTGDDESVTDCGAFPNADANAAYIAAFSPDVVLSLLDAAEERDKLLAKLAAAHAWESARYKGQDGKCRCETCKDYVRMMEAKSAALTPAEGSRNER